MEPTNNNIKMLLVFLFWCIVLFNPALAICVPRNQTVLEPPAFAPRTASAPVSPPKSPPSTAVVPLTPPPETPDSSPESSKTPSIQISIPTTVSDPQIKTLCGKTDKPGLCLAIIAPFFNGKTDLPSVVEMLIKAGTEKTKQAISTAAKMATEPKYSDPKSVSRFNDCKEIYDDALDNMQEAIDAIPVNDVGTIATMVSAAISDYGTCDDGFTGQPNPIPDGVSPMAKINENLINIAGVILAITNMMP